jgi:hypothetical protein
MSTDEQHPNSTAQFQAAETEGLLEAVREALVGLSSAGETVTNIQLRPMADGSRRWAVFTSTYDASRHEHDYRAVVNADGTVEYSDLTL